LTKREDGTSTIEQRRSESKFLRLWEFTVCPFGTLSPSGRPRSRTAPLLPGLWVGWDIHQ